MMLTSPSTHLPVFLNPTMTTLARKEMFMVSWKSWCSAQSDVEIFMYGTRVKCQHCHHHQHYQYYHHYQHYHHNQHYQHYQHYNIINAASVFKIVNFVSTLLLLTHLCVIFWLWLCQELRNEIIGKQISNQKLIYLGS